MRVSIIALALLGSLGAIVAADQPDWPQWRGPDRNGISSDKLELDWQSKTPELAWMVSGTGKGYASLALSEGKIYTTGNFQEGQSVVAMSATDGSVLWKKKITDGAPRHGYGGSRSTPAVDGDHLYVVSSGGAIACLGTDGDLKWKKPFSEWGGKMMSIWGYSESPLVDGDLVICTPGGPEGIVVALNKKTGEQVWACKAPPSDGKGKDGAGYSSVVVSKACGVKQYVTLVGRGVIGIRATDGKLLWTYNAVANSTANIPDPICFGDYVFCSSGYGTGAALVRLESADGGVTAKQQYFLPPRTFQNHHGGMVRIGGYVYAGHGHNKGRPICVELKTGKVTWGGKIRSVGSGSAAVAAVGDSLIFRYQSGDMVLLGANPKEYKFKGAFKPEYQEGKSWAHPVVIGGKMYLREQDKLMCYKLD